MKCGATISAPGLPTYMMKCFSKLTYTMAAYVETWILVSESLNVPRSMEWTRFSTPQVMAFALELYEAGILTDDDLPGMPVR